MMFLLRLAFWILVVCLLLPSDRDDNRRLMTSAGRTFSDVRGFCDRNPDVCQDARAIATSAVSKLRSGAELLQVWLAPEQPNPPAAVSPDAKAPAAADASPKVEATPAPPKLTPKWQDNLSPPDKQVPWRGQARL